MAKPKEYLTAAELENVVPAGRRIVRDTDWDRRYENYYSGIKPPDLEADPPVPNNELIYWYDHALDVVKKYNAATKEWLPAPASEAIPKLAFDMKTRRHVGYVEDEPSAKKSAQPASIKDILSEDEEL